jgi:hypothetical protein
MQLGAQMIPAPDRHEDVLISRRVGHYRPFFLTGHAIHHGKAMPARKTHLSSKKVDRI